MNYCYTLSQALSFTIALEKHKALQTETYCTHLREITDLANWTG